MAAPPARDQRALMKYSSEIATSAGVAVTVAVKAPRIPPPRRLGDAEDQVEAMTQVQPRSLSP